MTDNEIKKALDILDRFDLFGGQRAGRELWNEKPVDVQNEDIENFVKDVVFLKDLINRLQAKNEDKQTVIKEQGKIINGLIECQGKAIIAAYEEFAELVKANKRKLFNYIYSSKGFDNQIDNLLKEKVGEDNG